MQAVPAWCETAGGRLLLHCKVVPGASRDRVVGPLGDRLKIQVASPPEGGRANEAVRAVVAAWLGIAPSACQIERGPATPLKTLSVPAGTVIPGV